jgi:6-phosphofructokinase
MFSYSYLALVAALASEADWVFLPEWPPEKGWETTLCEKLAQVRTAFIVFVQTKRKNFLHPQNYVTFYLQAFTKNFMKL